MKLKLNQQKINVSEYAKHKSILKNGKWVVFALSTPSLFFTPVILANGIGGILKNNAIFWQLYVPMLLVCLGLHALLFYTSERVGYYAANIIPLNFGRGFVRNNANAMVVFSKFVAYILVCTFVLTIYYKIDSYGASMTALNAYAPKEIPTQKQYQKAAFDNSSYELQRAAVNKKYDSQKLTVGWSVDRYRQLNAIERDRANELKSILISENNERKIHNESESGTEKGVAKNNEKAINAVIDFNKMNSSLRNEFKNILLGLVFFCLLLSCVAKLLLSIAVNRANYTYTIAERTGFFKAIYEKIREYFYGIVDNYHATNDVARKHNTQQQQPITQKGQQQTPPQTPQKTFEYYSILDKQDEPKQYTDEYISKSFSGIFGRASQELNNLTGLLKAIKESNYNMIDVLSNQDKSITNIKYVVRFAFAVRESKNSGASALYNNVIHRVISENKEAFNDMLTIYNHFEGGSYAN